MCEYLITFYSLDGWVFIKFGAAGPLLTLQQWISEDNAKFDKNFIF